MASVVVSLSPTGSGAPSAADGATPLAGCAGDENQATGQAFSLLMKQTGKKAKADDLLLALTAAPAVPQVATPLHSLPVAGMLLPQALPQPVDAAPRQVGHDTSGSLPTAPANGAGQAVMAALAGSKAVKLGDSKTASNLPASNATGDDAHPAPPPGHDLAAQFAPPSDVGNVIQPPAAQAAPMLISDMSLLGQHRDAVQASQGTDGVAASQGAAALLQSPATAPSAAPPPDPTIAVPLRNSGWADELGSRISWMVRQDVQSASVKLNPPHLGPLEIKVSLVNDQVNVSFTAHHAPVREALDASLPRLRDILGSSGLQLGDANIAHHSHSDQQQSGQQGGGGTYAGGGAANDGTSAGDDQSFGGVHEPLYHVGDGAVDLYA